jgi:4-hydroxybutyrate---CoA ligase (AMP-forming)
VRNGDPVKAVQELTEGRSADVVIETAMVGMPDAVRDEVLGIFVVPKMGAEEEVVQHIRNTLGPVAIVGRIVILNKLPKTRTGKVMR